MEDRKAALAQLRGELAEALDGLGGCVSVRSSSVNEDRPDRSCAGRYRTVLGVRGLRALENALAAVWDSSGGHPMAVIIQRMLEPDMSGVLFTRNPITGSNSTVIESVRGLGESLVGGKQNPERLELPNDSEPGSTHPFRELFLVSRRLEAGFGYPLDIEWASVGGKFHILQARPITGMTPPGRSAGPSYSRVHAEEFFSGPVSPLFHSVFERLYAEYYIGETFRALGLDIPVERPQIVLHKNHLYASTGFAEYALASLRRGPSRGRLRESLPPDIREAPPGARRPKRGSQILRIAGFLASHPELWIWNLDRRFRDRTVPEITGRLDDIGDFWRMGLRELDSAYEELIKIAAAHIRVSKWGLVMYSISLVDIMTGFLERNGIPLSELPGLLTGLEDNRTLAASRELQGLARLVAQNGCALEIVRAGRASFPEYRKALVAVAGGELIVDTFESILTRHGHRSLSRDVMMPTWMDDPMIPFGIVRALVCDRSAIEAEDAPGARPGARKRRPESPGRVDRDTARGKVERRLPAGKRWLFRLLSRYLVRYASFRELQRFYLDLILARLRRLLLEISARMLDAGATGRTDDIFFLDMQDIKDFLHGGPARGLRGKALLARMAYEDRAGTPGRYLRAGVDFDAVSGCDEAPPSGHCLRGQSVSPGVHRGRARVLPKLDQNASLDRGDVIVTRCLDPGQTHFLMMAGALVLEVGGMLSHGAILAREMGVPTVARVTNATGIFKDGQLVRVNGTNGTVSVED